MDITRLKKKCRAVFQAAFLVGTFVVTVISCANAANTSITFSEALTVSCFQGNPEDGSYVGDITVPNPESASQVCNSLYGECRGKCRGCFSDSDITEDVCYDETGRIFLK